MISKIFEQVYTDASSVSQFSLTPAALSKKRLNFIYDHFDVISVNIQSIEIKEWGCSVYAKFRVPCLPSGIGDANDFFFSDIPVESLQGVVIFQGRILPKTPEILRSAAIAVPRDFKELVLNAARSEELRIDFFSDVYQTSKPLLIKEGDDTCILTYYEGLWYGFGHSATSLATLKHYRSTKRTLIFSPRYFTSIDDILKSYCSSLVVVDGVGVAKRDWDREEGAIRIGGYSEWYGSPFDTPDKFSALRFLRHLELLDALLK